MQVGLCGNQEAHAEVLCHRLRVVCAIDPRRPLVSVSSRLRRIRKLLPQLFVCVSRLVTMVCIWYTRSLGRLSFLDLLLRHNALVGSHPGPRKRQMNILLLVDTTIEGASPSHARQKFE